jgi:hypothetical protein
MSVNCNITVQFEVSKPDLLKETAREHHARVRALEAADDGFDRDALYMLEHASGGNGVGRGPKGDMFTWGHVGNYSSVERFVEALNDFWVDLYEKRIVMNCDGIVVMFQQEQHPFVKIVEMQLDRSSPKSAPTLEAREHETPFPLFGWYFERLENATPPGVRAFTIERKGDG